jgi:hypothetical protein
MNDETKHLPVIEDALGDEEAACSPSIYVSNEEAALLDAMRDLRRRSSELKPFARDSSPRSRAFVPSGRSSARDARRPTSAR